MTHYARRAALGGIAAGLGAAVLPRDALAQSPLAGDYSGVLDTGPVRLRLMLELRPNRAVLHSVDQGNTAIPSTALRISGDRVEIEFAGISARFVGRYDGNGTLAGQFFQGGVLPLVLKRGASVASLADPLAATLDGPMDLPRLNKLRLHLGIPGMAAAWRGGDNPATVICDGLRSEAGTHSVLATDKWHLGSITKSFTATLFARAVEAGTITWDTTVEQALGQKIGPVPQRFANTGPLELFSHNAGLAANIPLEQFERFPRTVTTDPLGDRCRYARIALDIPAAAPRHSGKVYSNCGPVIVAAMLEARLERPWEELVKDYVLAPLRLDSGGFGPPPGDQPQGHRIESDGKRTPLALDNPLVLGPSGRLHMTMADLMAYLATHRDRPTSFLARQSWAILHKPLFGTAYTPGWLADRDGTLWHNGSNRLWYAEASIAPGYAGIFAFAANDAALASRPKALSPSLRQSTLRHTG